MLTKAWLAFSRECREYIKATDVIEHVRSTLNMTNLNTAQKRKVDLGYIF